MNPPAVSPGLTSHRDDALRQLTELSGRIDQALSKGDVAQFCQLAEDRERVLLELHSNGSDNTEPAHRGIPSHILPDLLAENKAWIAAATKLLKLQRAGIHDIKAIKLAVRHLAQGYYHRTTHSQHVLMKG